ncbi:MAG: MFS transporter [Campylobacterales bacterium]|nr:MFS transporter [Campylobacterales bacterium]NLM99637.1 MFS transporter [Campylobacteraceae bacterium]
MTIPKEKPSFKILGAVSISHFLNDLMQSLIVALYPLLRSEFTLSFAQIGLITLTFQLTASMLQPLVGLYTDKHPKPYSLAYGMACTFFGLILFAFATNYLILLIAVAIVGTGSSIFHPESSRVARMASGGRFGLAQSIFQVGGNAGSAVGPLLAAWIVLPNGQKSIAWFATIAFIAMVILIGVGNWYKTKQISLKKVASKIVNPFTKKEVTKVLIILLILMFSKFFYLASINSYLMFYLTQSFDLGLKQAQYHLFYFLFSVALGTVLGGPIGDKIGRKKIILISIFGVAPFALMLPYLNLLHSTILLSIIGFMLASAFPAMVVYAQELIPGKVGAISGLFFGLSFGLGGIGAGVLGVLADHIGIIGVYKLTALLPLLGFFAIFLPNLKSN